VKLPKAPNRLTLLHACFLTFAAAIVVKAAHVQLLQAPEWKAQAQKQHNTSKRVPAPRGTIFDATGTVLVESRPLVKLSVAPREVRKDSRARLATELRRVDVPASAIARLSDTSRAWVTLPGTYLAADVAGATAIRGVYAEAVLERVPSPLPGLRGLIGHTTVDGVGLDGIELALDTLLQGQAGRDATVRDGHGLRLLSPSSERVPATAGHSIALTLRLDLQDITERALADAVRETGARGGDIVVIDPRTGELLALASRRSSSRATAATALTEPVEPGSTLKPFVAAALLEQGRVDLDDEFETHNGEFRFQGFVLRDVHRAPFLSFRDVIRHSSNIGMAQAALRLSPQEQYEALRDFGFGAATGLPFPSEASGWLKPPAQWSVPTQSAMARGYEILVTPVQLALAYAAIANGGELLQPALIKSIRDPEGRVVYEHTRTVVRRVISPKVAADMRELLRAVVDSGSATRAHLVSYDVGGKSGTARRTDKGKYVSGDYTANFVGLFPADDPQLVVLVKLDSPDATLGFYGGQIAAPVTRAVLQAAIASGDAALDRSRLRPRDSRQLASAARVDEAVAPADERDVAIDESAGASRYVLTVGGTPSAAPAVPAGLRAVPDVRGLSVRLAASRLHEAGFRVRVIRRAGGMQTVPAAGVKARAGTLVRLQYGGS
jgi:cell division protein FtsI (penicillin-binding protein 3)